MRLPQKTWLRGLSRMMPTLGLKPSRSSIIKPQFLTEFIMHRPVQRANPR